MLPFVFDLKESALHMIDTEEDLSLLEAGLKDCVVLGIDTETKPSFFPRKSNYRLKNNPTALVQLAVRSSSGNEEVFLVDMLTLASTREQAFQRLDIALKGVLEDEKCIKVGQSLKNDFVELRSSYPSLQAFHRILSIVDTTVLVKALQPDLKNCLSLKNMVKQYLHFDLSKRQQLSNWGKRPLTWAQQHYAACDALVLLRLYDAMTCEAEEIALEKGVTFDIYQYAEAMGDEEKVNSGNGESDTTDKSDCSDLLTPSSLPSSKKKKNKKKKKRSANPPFEPIKRAKIQIVEGAFTQAFHFKFDGQK
eukprot:gene8357-9214_t